MFSGSYCEGMFGRVAGLGCFGVGEWGLGWRGCGIWGVAGIGIWMGFSWVNVEF